MCVILDTCTDVLCVMHNMYDWFEFRTNQINSYTACVGI